VSRLPIDLYPEVVKPGGKRYRWDAFGLASDVPRNLAFSTKRMEGFSTTSLVLPRRIDGEYADLELHDDINIIDVAGDPVWEGRVAAAPRHLDAEGHSIQVDAVGWAAHMRDKSFRDIIVDREFSRWTGAGTARRAAVIGSGQSPIDPTVTADPVTGVRALVTEAEGAWAAGGLPNAAAIYDAGSGLTIGSLYFAWNRGATIDPADTNFSWQAFLGDIDTAFTSGDATAELRSAGPGVGVLVAMTTGRRFAMVKLSNLAAGGGASVKYPINWTCLAVYGTHGITKRGTNNATTAQGFYASDVMRYVIERYCPKLNTDGIQDTSFILPQIAWPELIEPYDACLSLNAPHLLDLAVWEDKTVHYGPVDLNDYDWQVRTEDPGVTVQLQGDSTEDLCNGIIVEYDSLQTGAKRVLTPAVFPQLRWDDETSPVNRHGLEVWTTVTLSIPATEAAALQIGQAMLAEFNQPKAPGNITVTGGYIRDRAGNWQPVSKVRATDTIAVVNHPNDRPRLITETNYTHPGQVVITVDSGIKRIDAHVDRVASQIRASNLVA
jgi:hypothetical protein